MDSFEPADPGGGPAAVILAARTTRYRLPDPSGILQAVHVRIDRADGSKTFRWEMPDGTRGLHGRPVASLPLYGLRRLELLEADAPIYLTEGEKASDALARLGLLALGTVTGAAVIPDNEPLSVLAGRDVRLWPDNDDIGREHMDRIASRLIELGASVSIIAWPEAPERGDAADFRDAGQGSSDVLALTIRSAHLGEGAWAERNPTTPIRSAQRPFPKEAERIPQFLTAREFAAQSPPEIDWIAEPWVAAGAITGVEGKIKVAGKTTFVTYLCRAILDGRPFLGWPTRRTGIVYLTEQPRSSLRETLRRADLLERDDLHLLSWRECAALPWPLIVELAVAECRNRGADLLVIDTLGRFAGIRGDGENSAGEAESAMAPLQLAAADGLAVIIIRHERKAGGDVGDAGRGSSAFGGAVDIVMAVRRTESGSSVRMVHALSRFDETPETLAIELTPDGYVPIGDDAALAQRLVDARLRDVLPIDPGLAMPIDAIVEATGAARTTIQRSLGCLAVARRLGDGKKGDPYRWWQGNPPGADAASAEQVPGLQPWHSMSDADDDWVIGTA